MWSDKELRDTTARILTSALSSTQKVRSLLHVRRQLKRFLRTVRKGIAHMDNCVQAGGANRLRRVEKQLLDGVGYVSDLTRAVAIQRPTFGYGPCAAAYPYRWEGAK